MTSWPATNTYCPSSLQDMSAYVDAADPGNFIYGTSAARCAMTRVIRPIRLRVSLPARQTLSAGSRPLNVSGPYKVVAAAVHLRARGDGMQQYEGSPEFMAWAASMNSQTTHAAARESVAFTLSSPATEAAEPITASTAATTNATNATTPLASGDITMHAWPDQYRSNWINAGSSVRVAQMDGAWRGYGQGPAGMPGAAGAVMLRVIDVNGLFEDMLVAIKVRRDAASRAPTLHRYAWRVRVCMCVCGGEGE